LSGVFTILIGIVTAAKKYLHKKVEIFVRLGSPPSIGDFREKS